MDFTQPIPEENVLSACEVFAPGTGLLLVPRPFACPPSIAIPPGEGFKEIDVLQKPGLESRRRSGTAVENFGGFIGQSRAHREVLKQIQLVAPTEANVLILGESGTGKELVARAIHERSRRRDNPMIRVNCASIPEELFESEFFGHAKGAFSGAWHDRVGRFEAADGGTLFLDEVGEIPFVLQAKLLRVLQEGEFERVGEEKTRRVNVRIIAATNRNLAEAAAAGQFRQDLYFRLGVFPLETPTLRSRPEDIPLLAEHLMQQAARRNDCPLPRLTQGNLQDLAAYSWPGNIRELQNVIERAVIVAQGGPLHFTLSRNAAAAARPPAGAGATQKQWLESQRGSLLAALEKCGGKIHGRNGAAALLGLAPSTLSSRLTALGIVRPRPGSNGSKRSRTLVGA